LLILVSSSPRYADNGVLSLAPLKRLALSVQVAPTEPRPQPPYVKPLPVQVKQVLDMAIVLEESAAPPPPTAAITAEEE
jgi:hypothetical protein